MNSQREKLTDTIGEMDDMNTPVENPVYGIGLDVGTGFLVSSKFKTTNKISFVSIRDAFYKLEKHLFNSTMFDKNKMKYIETEDEVFVVGEDAVTFARIQNSSSSRPLAGGIINPKEKSSAPVLRELFRYVLQGHIAKKDEILVFSIPGNQVDNLDFDTTYHSMSLESLLKQFRVKPVPINEGYAVIISELGIKEEMTGLGFSFGAGLVNCALVYKGINLFEFSIDKSGDFVDMQSSKAVGESTATMGYIKENKLNLEKSEYDVTPEERALIFSYRYIIQNTLAEVKKAFLSQSSAKVLEPIPIVISGGTSMPPGFVNLFKQELTSVKLPFEVTEIIHAEDPLRAVAKGCLIWANNLEVS